MDDVVAAERVFVTKEEKAFSKSVGIETGGEGRVQTSSFDCSAFVTIPSSASSSSRNYITKFNIRDNKKIKMDRIHSSPQYQRHCLHFLSLYSYRLRFPAFCLWGRALGTSFSILQEIVKVI